MNFIFQIFLLIGYGAIMLPVKAIDWSGTNLKYMCANMHINSLQIMDNPYVKPGDRDSNDVWYKSVTWEKIPKNQVMLWYKISAIAGISQRMTDGTTPFIGVDSATEAGSMSNLIRLALGIRPFTNLVEGMTIELDPNIFSSSPCTGLFGNYIWEPSAEYNYEFSLFARENKTEIVILKGDLKHEP